MATKVELDNPWWCGFGASAGALTAVSLFIALSAVVGGHPTDDSDASRKVRSGMSVRTDALTGCQYLDGGFALTPRLDATGHQICKLGAR